MKVIIKEEIRQLDVVTVTLVAIANSQLFKMFHCFQCRTPIVQYNGQVISIFPGGSPISPKVVNMCPNNNCRKLYVFEPLVSLAV